MMELISNFKKYRNFYAALAIILVPLFIFGAGYWLGITRQKAWSDSQYLQEREESNRKVAVLEAGANAHLENEKKLAAENDRLKLQNEAQAEILKKNDAQIKGDAKKLTDLLAKRNEDFKGIDANNSFSEQKCALCKDMKDSGFGILSFCGGCPK